MSYALSFQAATDSGLYDFSRLSAPEDRECAAFVAKLADLLPPLETDPFPLRAVVELKEAIASLPDPAGDETGFAAAFAAFTATLEKRFGRDGNGNPLAVGAAHGALLGALDVFHTAQDKVRLSESGLDHFSEIFRIRQIYRDMGHSGLGATTYDVKYP